MPDISVAFVSSCLSSTQRSALHTTDAGNDLDLMVASRYTMGQIISKFIICACLVCLPLHPISHFTDGLVLRTRVKVRQSRRKRLAVYFQKNQEFSVPEHSCKLPDDLMCGNVFTCTYQVENKRAKNECQQWVANLILY